MISSSVFNVKHDVDPADAICKAVGDLSWFHVGPARLLLGLYERPEKVGAIIRPDSLREEDIFQCKACLVLKTGPQTFVDNDATKFGSFSVHQGDWVMVRMNDGRRVDVCGPGGTGHQCIIVKDVHVSMAIPEPWMIW